MDGWGQTNRNLLDIDSNSDGSSKVKGEEELSSNISRTTRGGNVKGKFKNIWISFLFKERHALTVRPMETRKCH